MSRRLEWITRANALTVLRAVCIPLVACAIVSSTPVFALACFVIAVASDFADGWVARRYDEASPLGGVLDHAVDASFVTAATAALAWTDVLPMVLPPMIALAFVQYMADSRRLAERGLRASTLGRWNGIAYYVVVGVPVVRDGLGLGWPASGWIVVFGWLLVASTVVSMGDRLRLLLAREAVETPPRRDPGERMTGG